MMGSPSSARSRRGTSWSGTRIPMLAPLVMLKTPRRLLGGRQQEGIRPRRRRLEHAELPGFHLGVLGDLGQVAAHQREMMMAVGVANAPDAIERVLVADVAAERVTRIRRVNDEATVAHDLGGAPDQP